LYGPTGSVRRPPSAEEARAYCRQLARNHYENFTVASWLLPHPLRQHFYNVYAYCRWADDLADEARDPDTAGKLLDWWRDELAACLAGTARHPVFVALAETIREFEIPPEPLQDLLVAFRQDQRQTRYETFDDVLAYCRNSANPVGRLVLYLCRCHNDENVRLSDSICTGLQLANFCQDVARDFDRGRIYLPRESCRRFGYTEAMFAARECNDAFRALMAHEVERADSFLVAGMPLVPRVPRALRADVALFIEGGRAILRAIRAANYDVWSRRPTLSRGTKLRLVAWAMWKHRILGARP
jgi:squalene synthase HpnC